MSNNVKLTITTERIMSEDDWNYYQDNQVLDALVGRENLKSLEKGPLIIEDYDGPNLIKTTVTLTKTDPLTSKDKVSIL